MSLGAAGDLPARRTSSSSTRARHAAGVLVVGVGGQRGRAPVASPANCAGVIGVAGLRHIGTKVGFSDLGPQIALRARRQLRQHDAWASRASTRS